MPGGPGRIKKILNLLKAYQGWPLSTLEKQMELGGVTLDAGDVEVLKALAGDGFVPPPAIETSHHGKNFFLFGPRPGQSRLALNKKEIYERAMALVAAIRQGQLLYGNYKIRQPRRLLEVFRDRGWIEANSEAWEQYRQVAARKIGRLLPVGGERHRLEFIDNPDNREVVEMAINLLAGDEVQASADGEIVLALQKGQSYVESLIGRKLLRKTKEIRPDEETLQLIDDFLLGVRS